MLCDLLYGNAMRRDIYICMVMHTMVLQLNIRCGDAMQSNVNWRRERACYGMHYVAYDPPCNERAIVTYVMHVIANGNLPVGVVGRIELLNEKVLAAQPIVSVDWHEDKLGLGCACSLDQQVKVIICTKLNLY